MPTDPNTVIYVGRRRCGCVKAICHIYDSFMTREACWQMENDGLRVERMTIGRAMELSDCPHFRPPAGYEPPREVSDTTTAPAAPAIGTGEEERDA